MPTETRGRIKQTLYKYYGGTGASTAGTDHAESNETYSPENNAYKSFRSKYAPNSGAKSATSTPDSNGTIRRRRSTLLPSRPWAPSDRPGASKLRMKDVISLYQQIAKNGNRKSAVTEDSDGRSSHGSDKPPAAGGSKYPEFDHREEILSEESCGVPVFFGNSPSMPAGQYKDFPQKKIEGRRPHVSDLDRRPSTADGPVRRAHGDLPGSLPAVKKEMRRSHSLAGDKNSPASLTRRQTFAHTRSSSFSTRPSSRVEQPSEPRWYTGSNITPAHHAKIRPSQGGSGSSSNSSNPNLKLSKENPRFVSSSTSTPIAVTLPSSGEISHFEVKAENAGSNSSRFRKPTIDSWNADARAEVPATGSAMSSQARHSDDTANGILRQEDVPADFVGRLYRRTHSMSGRFRQEDASDLAEADPGRRSMSISRRFREGDASDLAADQGQRSRSTRHEHGSHSSSRRLESNTGNLPSEVPIDYTHVHGKQAVTGGHLRQDSASGTRGRMSSRTTLDVESRRDSESHSSVFSKRRPGHHRRTKVSIKGVAAAWYNGGWLQLDGMVPFQEDIAGFNKFLSDCKSEVYLAVPGRVLTVVLGKDTSDLGSIVSTMVYAYFLSCTGSKENSKCFVPVINMRQEDLVLHTEAVWLFKVAGIDTSNFIFIDQISLQSYHRFGNLKLVLVDHSRLAPHQEGLKEAVIEIVDNNVTEELYEWVLNRDIQEVGSCCTIIAERFAAEAPGHLAGRGLSRLLLGPILLETANLDANSARCTSRDDCMAALLINGAGRYGRQGFFRILRKMKFDISFMSTMDMMRKDFKKWTVGPGKTSVHGCEGRAMAVAMSTVGVPLWDVMDRKDILEDLKRFQKKFKLDLHLVVTGYYDIHDHYKREILLVPEDRELTQHVDTCFRAHEEALKLSVIHIEGLPEETLVFRQGQVTASRSVLRQILEDHFAM